MKHIKCIFVFIFIALLSNISYASDISSSIESPSAILIHADTGAILFEKNSKQRMYPASTTKIMTAILVLESGHSLNEYVTVSESAINNIPEGYSTAYLKAGEKFTLEQLLNVLLLPSANDAANVLAEYISGSIPAFADKMNKKAAELGCIDTHFVNPSGIHSEDHYSTAFDLSLIGRYAMENNLFRSFVNKTSCMLSATSIHPYNNRIFNNSNRLLYSDDIYYYPYAIGIKTGFTTPAGDCLVSASSKNGLSFIAVILGGKEDENNKSQRYSDTIALFNFGYENYVLHDFNHSGDVICEIQVENASSDTKNLRLQCDKSISALINIDEINLTSPEIFLDENIHAPIYKGDILGKIKYTILGIKYEANLVASYDVKVSPFFIYVLKIFLIVLLVVLILLIIFRNKKNDSLKIDNICL